MRHTSNSGFTIPEILVVLGVSGILITLTFQAFGDIFQSSSNGIKSAVQASEVQSALQMLKNELALTKTFSTGNDINDTLGPDNNPATNPSSPPQWTAGVSSTNSVLIAQTYAKTSSRALVYAHSPTCTTTPTPELSNNAVYFVSNNTLYRRTLKNTATTCDSLVIAQNTTCAPGVSHSSCGGTDASLLTNVSDFIVSYYTDSTSASPITSPTEISGAKTIVITLKVTNGTAERSESVRITRMNGVTL